MTLFQNATKKQNSGRPPVWFMRQAGRYHSHYQNLRAKNSFIDLCKKPEVACEATMGPIRDFDFDAAILFSDLLFPLEAMGMGLRYEPGPILDWHLKSVSDLKKLSGGEKLAKHMHFQAEAVELIRDKLAREKSLLGFVGGPLTLFCYAVDGSHAGGLEDSKKGIDDGRFEGFCDKLIPMLVENMALQARAGADAVALLDTCAGEFSPSIFREKIVPKIRTVLELFKNKCSDTPVIYYSKGSDEEHWSALEGLPFEVLGIDWRHDLAHVLKKFGNRWAIQGNIDPEWLFLESQELEKRLRDVFGKIKALPADTRKGWICGLGHGVLPRTPESSVHLFLKLQKEIFG